MSDTAIVLTAAINVAPGSTAVAEAGLRRDQYLAALRFYADFAPVYFLENTGYDLRADLAFAIPGVRLRPVTGAADRARGKGYQEFAMLDAWHGSEQERPDRFIKITGRYLCRNIADLLGECQRTPDSMLLFDQYRHDRVALTSIFSVTTDAYGRYLQGLYQQADDRAGLWIEHVVFRNLAEDRAPVRFFRHEPQISGISGSSGQSMQASRLKHALRQSLRSLNRLYDRRFLYFRGTALGAAAQWIR